MGYFGADYWGAGQASDISVGNAALDSFYVAVGATPSKTVTCNTTLTGRTLKVIFENLRDTTDVSTIADGSLTKSGTNVAFSIPAAVTTTEKTLRCSVRDTSNNDVLAEILCFVTYQPKADA